MKTTYVFLAEGFEEIEAVTPIDVMRRAGITVKTVALGGQMVTGAHGVPVLADLQSEGFALPEDAAAVVLPGGPGHEKLMESTMVAEALQQAAARGIVIAAVCAAPRVLHKYGLLAGKRVTAFPSVQGGLSGSTVTGAPVEIDGNIITGRSAGVALQFAHALAAALVGEETAGAAVADLYPEQ